MKTLNSTPRADGFHMPAEWAPQTQVWMVWPERPDNWRLGGKPAQAAFTAVAKAIAQFMTEQLPERFTATSGPKNRVGKIFIDYLRNARGASTVAAYSVRARPGLPVSVRRSASCSACGDFWRQCSSPISTISQPRRRSSSCRS